MENKNIHDTNHDGFKRYGLQRSHLEYQQNKNLWIH
jgi:hypothetical protein